MLGRLNYANVMSTIAMFAALGGGVAIAATAKKDTVTSKSIRDGQVRTKDIADESVTSAKVQDGSLTDDDIDVETLVFRCADGEFAASGGGPCFFVINTSGSTWQQAIAECAARRAQIPTVAEIAAIVPIGPSPAADDHHVELGHHHPGRRGPGREGVDRLLVERHAQRDRSDVHEHQPDHEGSLPLRPGELARLTVLPSSA